MSTDKIEIFKFFEEYLLERGVIIEFMRSVFSMASSVPEPSDPDAPRPSQPFGLYEQCGVPVLYAFADFTMRVGVLLVAFQISNYTISSNSGSEGLLMFFQTNNLAMVGAIIGLILSIFADSKLGVLLVGLISVGFLFIASCLGIIVGSTGQTSPTSYLFRVFEVFNYSTLIFEPTRLLIVLFYCIERTSKFRKQFCVMVVWLRELAILAAFGILKLSKLIHNFYIISNMIAMICGMIYAVIICTVHKIPKPAKGKYMALKIVKCYMTYMPSVNNVRSKFFEQDSKFTMKEKYCTIQFLRVHRALSAFILFYFAQQLLYIIWDFQTKLVKVGGNYFLESIHLKLSFINLVNLPLIFFGLFPLLAKTKRTMFTNNFRLLGFAYIALLLALMVSMWAQFISAYLKEDSETSPGPEQSMIRIFNMLPEKIDIDSTWTGHQTIQPYSEYISDKFEARGITSSQLLINGPGSLNQFSKSIFSKELNSATFIVMQNKMRRVTGYDDIHEGVLDRRGPVAIISTLSTLEKEFSLKVLDLDTRQDKSLYFPSKSHLKNTQIFPPGDYQILHSPPQSISLKLGTVYNIMMYANSSMIFPTDYHYIIRKQYELQTLPYWGFIALYFLSFASMTELVLICIFILSECPQSVRVLAFSFYFFHKALGSGCLYLLSYVFKMNNLTTALFVTFWIYFANGCYYWAVMVKFKSLRYTPDDG